MLHTPTLFLLSVALCVALAGMLAYVGVRRHPELLLWAAALLCNAGTYALYSGRGQISDLWSVVAANVVLAASYALLGEGAYRFNRQAPPRLLLWSPVAGVALCFPFMLDDFQLRVVVGAVIGVAQLALVLAALRLPLLTRQGRGAGLVATGIATAAAIYFLRAGTVLADAATITSLTDFGGIQDLSFSLAILSELLLAVGLLVMIAERSEAQLRETTRIQALGNGILEMISQSRDLPEILRTLVLGLERIHPELRCSVLLLDETGQCLRHGAAPSLPDDYNTAVDGLRIGPHVGSCGTAAYTGRRVVVKDIATHPDWAPLKDLALRSGLHSCWSQPVLSSTGRVLGTFALYKARQSAPTEDEIALIEQMAHLAQSAIERSRWAQELRRSENQYRRLFESAHEGICIVHGGRIEVVNPMLQRQLGCEASALIGRDILELVHEDDRGLMREAHQRQLRGDAAAERQTVRVLTRHAGVRWFEISGVRLELEGRTAVLMFLDDVTERRLMDERIRELAFHDSLTRLPNRRLMLDRLALAVASNRRTGRRAALLFMDLDNFKPLNDLHGHHVGDLLLIEVGHRLRRCIREVDTVARFGGDEFAVLLVDLDPEMSLARAMAAQLAERIAERLAEPYTLRAVVQGRPQDIEHRCSASIGVHMLSVHEGPVGELIDRADAAMYEAKKAGRHAVRFSDPGA